MHLSKLLSRGVGMSDYDEEERLRMHDRIEKLEAENERLCKLAETLREIANDGCGHFSWLSGGTCRDKHPTDPSEWCWCCIAQEAIEKMEGSE
jgi:hypothetical protein